MTFDSNTAMRKLHWSCYHTKCGMVLDVPLANDSEVVSPQWNRSGYCTGALSYWGQLIRPIQWSKSMIQIPC